MNTNVRQYEASKKTSVVALTKDELSSVSGGDKFTDWLDRVTEGWKSFFGKGKKDAEKAVDKAAGDTEKTLGKAAKDTGNALDKAAKDIKEL